ncbi:MAG: YaaC family protein [Chloroflexi bacterium]|nr:YaaC family protein [Chloroflexota bacterium]
MATRTVFLHPFERYDTSGGFSSAFDPLDDLVLHLDFLAAINHTIDLLRSKHGVSASDARSRAIRIRPHARLAAQYIRQARTGPVEVSFVPSYYAILNLVKVWILCSSEHARLKANRLHGASYNPTAPLSRALTSEVITLYPSGAIPLFYEVLTGRQIVARTQIAMRDIYPYIADVGTEWSLASRTPSRQTILHPSVDSLPSGLHARFSIETATRKRPIPVTHLPALRGCQRDPAAPNQFVTKAPLSSDTTPRDVICAGLDRRFLYYPNSDQTMTAVMPGPLLMPEALPATLAFYHLSSVARYNPEFLERLSESKHWPVVAALRPHALYKFLLLFWSFMRQSNVSVGR